jgi:hypothetical protein
MSPETAAMLEIGNTGPATDGDRDDIGKNQNQTPNAKGATVFRSIDSPSSIIKNASNGAIMGKLEFELDLEMWLYSMLSASNFM